MARKKKEDINSDSLKARLTDSNAKDMPAIDQPITEMLEINYMPYAMSVIVSRAIPEIDGFKPSHRKLLYTMYKMGLLGGNRTKSANVVGQTMKLNPHGDQAIYDTMVRLTRGNGSLLHPFVDWNIRNGFTVRETTTCVDPANYSEEIGKGICLKRIEDKIWLFLGYAYRTNLHNNLNNKEVSDDISLLFYIEYKENETQILVEQ